MKIEGWLIFIFLLNFIDADVTVVNASVDDFAVDDFTVVNVTVSDATVINATLVNTSVGEVPMVNATVVDTETTEEPPMTCELKKGLCVSLFDGIFPTTAKLKECNEKLRYESYLRFLEIDRVNVELRYLQNELEFGPTLSMMELVNKYYSDMRQLIPGNYSTLSSWPENYKTYSCEVGLTTCKEKKIELKNYMEKALQDMDKEYRTQFAHAKQLTNDLEEIAILKGRFRQRGVIPDSVWGRWALQGLEHPVRYPYVKPTSEEFRAMTYRKMVFPIGCSKKFMDEAAEDMSLIDYDLLNV